jgi:predicted dehydrogenase
MTAARAKLGTIRVEEDVLFSLSAHDVALALWLLGDEALSASAVGVDARGTGIDDAAFLSVTFRGGAVLGAWASWLYPVPTRRFAVVGDRAMASVIQERRGPGELVIHEKGAREGEAGPEVYDEGSRTMEVPPVDLLEAELAHFLECVDTRRTPRADGRQGLETVKVLAAAQKSASAAGAPVRLEG